MKDQETIVKKRLNLGIDAIGTVDTILSWKRLESCFGDEFSFSHLTKHKITHELAVQQRRIRDLEKKDKPAEILILQEASKNLSKSLEALARSGNSKIASEIIDIVNKKAGINFTQLENAVRSLENIHTSVSSPRPNDLYREIIRKLVTILETDEIPLTLHVQSSLNKFMTELDRQMPETIFPISHAKFIAEGRIRILRDYLRGHLRNKG